VGGRKWIFGGNKYKNYVCVCMFVGVGAVLLTVQKLNKTPKFKGHAVAQFVEALPYSRKVAGSIPDGVIGIFH